MSITRMVGLVYTIHKTRVTDTPNVPQPCHEALLPTHKFCPECGRPSEIPAVALKPGFLSASCPTVQPSHGMSAEMWHVELPRDLHFDGWVCKSRGEHVEVVLAANEGEIKEAFYRLAKFKDALAARDIPWEEDALAVRAPSNTVTLTCYHGGPHYLNC